MDGALLSIEANLGAGQESLQLGLPPPLLSRRAFTRGE